MQVSVYIDFDGTLCQNELQHYQAFNETLIQLGIKKTLPEGWFGLTTEQVYDSMNLSLVGITSSEFIKLKRENYKKKEKESLISTEIVRFLRMLPKHTKIEIFSNGASERIKAFLKKEGLKINIFSFADIGCSKYNKEDFFRYFKGDVNSKKMIIDDSIKVIDLCDLFGFKGVKFDPEKFDAEKAYEIYNSLSR